MRFMFLNSQKKSRRRGNHCTRSFTQFYG